MLVAIVLGLEALLCPFSRINYEIGYLPNLGVYVKMPRVVDPRPGMTGLVMMCLFSALFWQLTLHMREQFGHAETHLIPDFRRVHARVSVAVMILAVSRAGRPALLRGPVRCRFRLHGRAGICSNVMGGSASINPLVSGPFRSVPTPRDAAHAGRPRSVGCRRAWPADGNSLGGGSNTHVARSNPSVPPE